MKTIIVYDSTFGNTEMIARAIAAGAAAAGETVLLRASQASGLDFAGAGLLFVGSPVHGGQYTEAVKTFLDALPAGTLRGMRTAAFDTAMSPSDQGFLVSRIVRLFGSATPRLVKALLTKGATIAGEASFIVLGREGPLRDGETERASRWAAEMAQPAGQS